VAVYYDLYRGSRITSQEAPIGVMVSACHKSDFATIKNIEIMVKGESAVPVQCSWP
jgi:hypothetical protein